MASFVKGYSPWGYEQFSSIVVILEVIHLTYEL